MFWVLERVILMRMGIVVEVEKGIIWLIFGNVFKYVEFNVLFCLSLIRIGFEKV